MLPADASLSVDEEQAETSLCSNNAFVVRSYGSTIAQATPPYSYIVSYPKEGEETMHKFLTSFARPERFAAGLPFSASTV